LSPAMQGAGLWWSWRGDMSTSSPWCSSPTKDVTSALLLP